MITIARCDKNPKVLVVTPLLPGHKISKKTKITIKRNNTQILWLHSSGNHNIPTNVQNGLNYYLKNFKHTIPYILPLDRDIILGRNMIDKMISTIHNTPDNIAFTYTNFEFKGTVNQKFPTRQYDINTLVQNNYISSNSLIKIDKLTEIGGLITNEKYKRLLDWVLWLTFYTYNYIGIPTFNANFTAISTNDDISAGTGEDFIDKRKLVLYDIIKPLIEKFSVAHTEPIETQEDNALSFDEEF